MKHYNWYGCDGDGNAIFSYNLCKVITDKDVMAMVMPFKMKHDRNVSELLQITVQLLFPLEWQVVVFFFIVAFLSSFL